MKTRSSMLVYGLVLGLASCRRGLPEAGDLIGMFGGVGLAPGAFNYPRGITAEATPSAKSGEGSRHSPGSVYVVDRTGRIQRFSADGAFETAWRMPEIEQGKPVGMAAHPDGRLFVADTHYHRVLIFDRDGAQIGSFGHEGKGDGQFMLPTDVAFDRAGFVYVGEYHENDRITKWSPDLQFVQAIGTDPVDGTRLSRPGGIAVDEEDTLWVADSCNHRLLRYALDGRVVTTFGKFGSGPGEMRYPYDVTVLPNGNLVVCEYEGGRLQWFSKDGRSLRVWGRHGRAPGELFAPWGVAYGPMNRLYVVDALNNRVQIVRP